MHVCIIVYVCACLFVVLCVHVYVVWMGLRSTFVYVCVLVPVVYMYTTYCKCTVLEFHRGVGCSYK